MNVFEKGIVEKQISVLTNTVIYLNKGMFMQEYFFLHVSVLCWLGWIPVCYLRFIVRHFQFEKKQTMDCKIGLLVSELKLVDQVF